MRYKKRKLIENKTRQLVTIKVIETTKAKVWNKAWDNLVFTPIQDSEKHIKNEAITSIISGEK